jgi:cytoskeletal protein CcmA (bactofilin family)
VRVKVKGDMTTETGEVIAEEVEIEGQPGGRAGGRIEGRITAASGTCPALTLTVNNVTVTTSASTYFDGVSCASLTVGTKVEVEGDLQGTTLVATKIERE